MMEMQFVAGAELHYLLHCHLVLKRATTENAMPTLPFSWRGIYRPVRQNHTEVEQRHLCVFQQQPPIVTDQRSWDGVIEI